MKYDILVLALKGNKYSCEWWLCPKAGPVADVLLAENQHLVLEIPVDRNFWRWSSNPPETESSENQASDVFIFIQGCVTQTWVEDSLTNHQRVCCVP